LEEWGGFVGVVLVCIASIWLAAVALLSVAPAVGRVWCVAVTAVGAAAGALLAHAVWPSHGVLTPALLSAGVTVLIGAIEMRRGRLSPVGATNWAAWSIFGAVTLWWAVGFLMGLPLSPLSKGLIWLAFAVSAVTVPSAVVTTREGWEPILLRRQRPTSLRVPVPMAGESPRVSIHVPCHAEPPDLVIETLDRLAELDYDNYEVLVIDNNTTDPELWMPVKEHCRRLGDQFRFFHVDGLTGAKAGALNWALPHSDPEAVLVGVVDADYHVEPEWLRGTVGYFDDTLVGFVQAPHAYRDYETSLFKTSANWEYAVFFQTGMLTLNARGAGLTVGTMSLIRKRALIDAGGWAEWCLTEDSELSIRIHAIGYRSIYLTEPYGRGLVPDTFESYRRQRFRWTFGPVQEFRQHWRLYLPRVLGGTPNKLSWQQKLHHANHGLDVMGIGIRAVALVLGAAATVSMAVHGEYVAMPFELWIASSAALVSSSAMRLLVYRRVVGATVARSIGGVVAFAALSAVIVIASIRSSIGLSAAWHRTNKFRPKSNWQRAIAATNTETTVAVACLALAASLIAFTHASGVITTFAIALLLQGATLLSAPVLSLIANRDLPVASAPSNVEHPTTSDVVATRV
jgi:cellulose synthase/poly-beta-1,6-N-acetylglucosamine synthase-like glycosyltransferase